MSPLRRRCPVGFHAHRDEVASSVLCPWGCGKMKCLRRMLFSFGSPRRLVESFFALAMQVGSHLRRPRCEASGAPVGFAWAYRDVLKGAQAVLSVVRRACELGTLLIRVP
ncbi:hypothetical protein CRG98_018898 [Punica granatum]|uniref:Uncharacterized protein n=1 Tax=Punica granatum TaxID=22663 RepID=A0A2I0JWK6_PUNGR|nr:hypothetical protein CRG98_018898 [Punica granatum]